MFKEFGVFMLGRISIGLAVLLFSAELPVFDLTAVPTTESLKYTASLFTAGGALLLFISQNFEVPL